MSATNTKQSQRANRTTRRQQGPREGSVVWAMIQVLDGKRTPMRPDEILAAIQQRGLAKKLGGKTPEASVAARLAVHVGIYFERPEKGKYLLKKGITAKSITSETGSKTAPTTTTRRSGTGSKASGHRKARSKGRRQQASASTSASATPSPTEPPATESPTTA